MRILVVVLLRWWCRIAYLLLLLGRVSDDGRLLLSIIDGRRRSISVNDSGRGGRIYNLTVNVSSAGCGHWIRLLHDDRCPTNYPWQIPRLHGQSDAHKKGQHAKNDEHNVRRVAPVT